MTHSKKPITLLILAGGLGTRYANSKQVDGIGPNGEFLMEYTIYDAWKAGFTKVVIIVHTNVEKALEDRIGKRFQFLELVFVKQTMDTSPRIKPWGTGYAVLCAKSVINEPFMIVNADDYYGRRSFEIGQAFISEGSLSNSNMGLIAFQLNKTLSDHGGVSRGICQVNQGVLIKVEEHEGIQRRAEKIYSNQIKESSLKEDLPVSMNCWLLHPSVFNHLQRDFDEFYSEFHGSIDREYYLPTAMQELINSGAVSFQLMRSNEQWFGLTFPGDKQLAQQKIKRAIDRGIYPKSLIHG